jgi:Ca2+-binding RTX toxin-like protein
MKKHGVLIGALATLAVGVSAAPAFAGTVRVDTVNVTGVKRILFTESQPIDPLTGKPVPMSKPLPEQNDITITNFGGLIVVKDATTALTAGAKCTQVDANAAACPPDGITQLNFNLGAMNDTFDNETATDADINGGSGSDRIINSGGGNDLISLNGSEFDQVDSCGAGDNDKADLDHRDFLAQNSGCENVFVDNVQILPVPVTPPPVTGGGTTTTPPPSGGGTAPPPPPVTQAPIQQAPAGTAAPVSAPSLGVAPTAKAGACVAKFIGTAAADRIDGSNNGDIEYGQAGNDYLRGQAGDDCLYGMDGADTMIGDEGLDLLVGGNGNDKGFGGAGNDKLYGNAGRDTLQGDAGNDRISGGASADKLYGNAGNDKLYGASGNDLLNGGAGNDYLSGGLGRDHMIGGSGSDTIVAGHNGGNRINGGSGADKIRVRNHHKDIVECGAGRDTVTADKVDVLRHCEHVSRR